METPMFDIPKWFKNANLSLVPDVDWRDPSYTVLVRCFHPGHQKIPGLVMTVTVCELANGNLVR